MRRLLILFVLLAACSNPPEQNSDSPDANTDVQTADIQQWAPPTCSADGDFAREQHTLGPWNLHLTRATGAWRVTRGAEDILESAGPCEGDTLKLHRGEPDVKNLFGAFQIDLNLDSNTNNDWDLIDTPPHGVQADENLVSLLWDLEDEETTIRLEFALYEGRDLQLRLRSTDETHRTGELGWSCQADESFFGLGTQSVGMDLRGRTYPLWTQEQGNSKPEDGGNFPLNNIPEAAYAPMGVLFSSAGYAGLVGHDGYHEVDLCNEQDDALRLRSYPELPSMIFVDGDGPKDRVESITEYTGRTTSPPDWVFGPWNDAVGGPDRLWNVANTLRDNDIPSSAIWAEDWIGGRQTANGFRLTYAWEWDVDTYPNLPDDIDQLHQKGFAFLGYFNPFIPQSVDTYEEAETEGYLIEQADGTPYTFLDPAFRTASLVDLSNPDAEDWLKGYLRQAADDLKIDGWMADFAEWLPVDSQLAGDTDPWLFHNRYPMEWQRIHREVFEEVVPRTANEADNNWTFFPRSGWASINGGTSGLAPTLWGGDQNTDWKYDDGLPTIIPIAAHVGLAGVAIFGSDIAGYSSLSSDNTTKELFLRWSSIGAFHPLMRTHHGSEKCDNWMFDRDQETLQHYRRYAKIHTLLLPFWRNLADVAVERGLPIIRHPYLVEPNTPRLWEGQQYQYFLGDDILVAPVLEQAATTRTVVLPDGEWWPLFGDESMQQDEITVDADVTEIPVFVRAATILPLLMNPVDSLYGAPAAGVTDQDDITGAYRLVLYPDSTGLLTETTAGSALIEGQDWPQNPDWSSAELNGDALPLCPDDDEEPTQSCRHENSVFLTGENIHLTLGDAQLTLTSDNTQSYRIALAHHGWDPFDEPTALTDLTPETQSYCDEIIEE